MPTFGTFSLVGWLAILLVMFTGIFDAGFPVPSAFAMDTGAVTERDVDNLPYMVNHLFARAETVTVTATECEPTSTLTTIEISLPPFIIPGTSTVSAPEGGISTVHITLPTTVATTVSGPGGISTVHITLPGLVPIPTTLPAPEGGISTVHFTIHPTVEELSTFNTATHPIPAKTVTSGSNNTESVVPLHSVKTTGAMTLINSTQAPSVTAHPNGASFAKGIHNHSVLVLAVGLAYLM
ncbi:hypothetical protein N7510_011172 [Penicillium lagena]|uniref:uncharacterized protein n=1 Tax=Penicillium lagena TaxID=94218 RepID=UPI00253FDA66|nr:uncharacterized protein N7510_011172 [Penicillium lagena]KAJ5601638.1 hypothetical protein N7510_011172 [Penicillium lagena]